MNTWSYAVLDDQGSRLALKQILTSDAARLSLVRYFEKDETVHSRVVTIFDVADYQGNASLRNVECFHLTSRIMGHEGALQTAQSLVAMFTTLRNTSLKDPASALAALREGDVDKILSGMSARLRGTSVAAAA